MRLDNKYIGKNFFCINTDANGITTQHLQYLPYGELFVEQRSTANYFTPYKFSAKEKDEETSYSYFGARYLATDFSFWLSVDPMSDKYPHQSGYSYCGWRPINVIDPDGLDEWELSQSGHIINRITNKEKDVFYITGKDGKRNTLDFNKRIISNSFTIDRLTRNDETGKLQLKPIDIYQINGDENASKLFEFVSNANNSNVEWGLTKVGEKEGKNGINLLSTSHDDGTELGSSKISEILMKFKINIRGNDHSHPDEYKAIPSGDPNNKYSGGDVNFAFSIEQKNKNAKFRIYLPETKGYYPYNSNGLIKKQK